MLEKINKDFEKGIRLGNRLGETPQEDFMSRPEFVRRDNRLTTAPSKAVSETKTKAATPAAGNDNKVVQLTPTPQADPKPAEKGKKKVVSIAENQATADDDQPVKHQRKKKQAQTARLMYLGDLEEKDEDDMRKLWQQWKSQDLEGSLVAPHDSEEDQNPKNDIQNAVEKLRTEAARKAEAEDSDGPHGDKAMGFQVAQVSAQNDRCKSQTLRLEGSSSHEQTSDVALMKQEFERRERSLVQMLEQARLGQEEEQRTADMQMALKLKRQEELLQASEAKVSSLEESAKRQEELYERHVGQMTQQIRTIQESFRKQLEVAQAENDEQLQAAVAKLAEVEKNTKAEREQVRAEHDQEKEEQAAKLAQADELIDKVAGLTREIEELRKQLLQARMKLLDRPVVSAQPRLSAPQPKGRRRLETDPQAAAVARRKSVRMSLLPPNLLEKKSEKELSREVARSRPPADRRATLAVNRGENIADLADFEEHLRMRVRCSVRPVPATAVPSKARLLRPTLQENGQTNTADVGLWRRIERAGDTGVPTMKPSDGAVTVLCFREALKDDTHEILAVGCKNGALSIYRIRRTALERGASDAATDGEDIEVVAQRPAHAKAIMSMCFGAGGDHVVTSSSDRTVRVFSIQQREFLENMTIEDTAWVVCVVSLPKPAGAFITANANAVLQLRGSSVKQQKVRLDHYARSMVLVSDGKRLLVGTSRGRIHAFDVTPQGLERLESQQIGNTALTCLTPAPCADAPPLLAANCMAQNNAMDNTVCILQANKTITNFTVLKRFANPHRLLPLRSCHVPGCADTGEDVLSAGFLATGAEDGFVRVFDLE
ncbi:CPK3, partial [Symbiodinium sp. CCMP2456]